MACPAAYRIEWLESALNALINSHAFAVNKAAPKVQVFSFFQYAGCYKVHDVYQGQGIMQWPKPTNKMPENSAN